MEKLDDVARKPTENKVLNAAAPSKVGRKKHKCGLCDASFGRSFDLKMHIRIHTGEKPHKCDVCGASFIASGQLKKHIRSHTGEKPYKCTLCDSSFVKSCKLKIHMRVHTGEKPYKCTICEASFINSCKLKIHNRIHTGEKPYKCTFCDGAFSHSSSYKNHIRTHTGEKPYKCTMCEASFMNSCHLKKHITIHAEVQLYKCDLCAATFTQPQLLKRHMRIHTGERPHKCTLCDATFAESHELMTHMKVHTGDKPHKCTQCNASFSQSGALKNHMRIHTGEKPYKCNICGATFSFSRGMSKHMESHRGAETSWWMIQERTNKSSKEEANDDYSYREGSLNAVAESSTPYESELVGPVVQKLKEEIQMALCNQTLSQGTMFPGKVEPDEEESCGKVSLEGNVENSSHDENDHLEASFVQVMLKEEPEISICNKSLPQGNMPPVEVDLDENNYPCNESHGEGGLDGVESSHREHELVDSSFVQVVLKEEPEMRIYNETLHQGTMLPVKEEPDENECYYNESCEGSFDGIVESSSHGSEHVGPSFVQVMVKEEPE